MVLSSDDDENRVLVTGESHAAVDVSGHFVGVSGVLVRGLLGGSLNNHE